MTFAILMIYFAGVATIAKVLSAAATGITALGLIFLIANWIDDNPDEKTVIKFKKWIKLLSLGFTASVFLLLFTPSEKTLYMLAGADVAGQVADKASPVLNKTLELIEQKLDEELKGTKRERNNE